MRGVRGVRLAGFGVAAALLSLTACTTGSPDVPTTSAVTSGSASATSATSSSGSTTTSATTSSTVAPPAIPDAAKANTADGATTFADFYLKQADKAFNSLDPTIISALSSPTCVACQDMVSSIDDWKSKNYVYRGQYANPTYVTILKFPGNDTASVYVISTSSGATLKTTSGALVKNIPADTAKLAISLGRTDAAWRIVEIKLAS